MVVMEYEYVALAMSRDDLHILRANTRTSYDPSGNSALPASKAQAHIISLVNFRALHVSLTFIPSRKPIYLLHLTQEDKTQAEVSQLRVWYRGIHHDRVGSQKNKS
jgi:hypothetical protein